MVEKQTNVLFVCAGNLCRSPMAEYLFRSRLGPDSGWTAGSAGLAAMDGLAASQTAIEVMQAIGIDIRTHRSRELTPELIDAATIILAMTNAQSLEIKTRFPKARDRVHLLGSFRRDPGNHAASAGTAKDIADPIGASGEVYRRTLNDIAGCMDGLISYLQSFRENKHL